MISRDFQRQVNGYGLTTAQILYRRPDHPWLLQTYVWQEYDLCPDFPELNGFLRFWQTSIEGALHTVRMSVVGERLDLYQFLALVDLHLERHLAQLERAAATLNAQSSASRSRSGGAAGP